MTSHGSSLLDLAAGRVHDLGGRESFTAGRSRDADLPLADPSCSRRHFRIGARGGGYQLESLSEANPTFCDGRPVAGAVPLRDGLPKPGPGGRLIVLGSFFDQPATAKAVGAAVGRLRYHHRAVARVTKPGIRAWVFQ